jgi:hypothetical protein
MNLVNSNAVAIISEQRREDAPVHKREFLFWASDPTTRQVSRHSQELGLRFQGPLSKGKQNIGGLAQTGRLFAIAHFGLTGFCQDDSARLKELRIELMDPLVDNYHGNLVSAVDGALLGIFVSALEATRCAVDIQRSLSGYVGIGRRIRLRVGIDVGEIMMVDTMLYGETIDIAARLHAICPLDGVCISGVTYESVRNRLNVKFQSLSGSEQQKAGLLTGARVFWPTRPPVPEALDG